MLQPAASLAMRTENTVCIAVRDREGRLLFLKRSTRTFLGWWCLPGGHEEKGESHHQAAQREASEEVGEIEVEKEPFLVFEHDWPADRHTGEPHRHRCHSFMGKAAGELKAGDGASEIGWFTLEAAGKLKITEYTRRVLEALEPFDVVDGDDKVIGKASRHECHSGSMLLHRSIGIIITNSRGEFLFQKRSTKKDTDPGRWVVGVGGHVDAGESYERAAERETKEEIGIECKPRFAFNILVEMAAEREMVNVYTCTYDGPFRADKEEIDELKFIPRAEAIRMLKSGRMTEFDTQIMKRFFGLKTL